MKTFALIALAVLITALAPSAKAVLPVFTLSTETTTDTDVLNLGGTALAFDYSDLINSTGPTTVHGVVFTGSMTGGTGVTLGISGFDTTDNNGINSLPLGSPSYANILTDLGYNSGVTGSLTFNNLVNGDVYELQVFSGTTGLGTLQGQTLTDQGVQGTTYFDGGDGVSSYNYYIDETFTAGSGAETVSIAGLGGGFIILNAVNLRDLSAPEPSTYAMLFGGLGLLVLVSRFRRKLTA
jgi:hypothetical protein